MSIGILFLLVVAIIVSIINISQVDLVEEDVFISDTDLEMFDGKTVVMEVYDEGGVEVLIGRFKLGQEFASVEESEEISKTSPPRTYHYHLHKDMKDIISINLLKWD